jgi:hypothetical protein
MKIQNRWMDQQQTPFQGGIVYEFLHLNHSIPHPSFAFDYGYFSHQLTCGANLDLLGLWNSS